MLRAIGRSPLQQQFNNPLFSVVRATRRRGDLPIARNKIIAFLAFCFLIFLFSASAYAATRTWSGGSNANWNNSGNWDTLPVAGDDLVFPSGGANKSTNNDFTADTSFNSITISGTGNYTLAGNSVIVTGTITDSATSNTNVISMVMKGTAALTKSGAGGTLTLSGTNTFSGGVTLSAGGININSASALGTGTFTISGGTLNNTSSGAITLSTNNPMNWNSDFTFWGAHDLNMGTGAVTLGSNCVITTSWANTSLTVGGAIGDGGHAYTLTKAGHDVLILAGANTYTGLTTVSSGSQLSLSGDNSAASGGVTLADTGTLFINSATALGTGTFTINGGFINSSADVTVTTNNVQNWNGDFTFLGGHNLNLGTGAVTLGGNRQVTTSWAAGKLTVGGAIGDGGHAYTFTKSGHDDMVLAGSNTYTGLTTISSGAYLVLSGDNTAASGGVTVSDTAWLMINSPTALGTGTFTINGGTLRNSSGSPVTVSTNNVQNWNGDFSFYGQGNLNLGNGAVTLGANRLITLYDVGASILTVGGVIGDGGHSYTLSVTADNQNSTMILSGANTFTGATTISAGVLKLNNANALQNSTVTVNHANALTFAPSIGTFTFGGLAGSSNLTLADTGATAITLQAGQNNANTTYSGVMSDAGAFTKQGSGTLILSAANTYTGSTTISGGTLQQGIANAIKSATTTISSGGTLDLSTYDLTLAGGTSFSNTGTLKLFGDQTVTNTPTNNATSAVEYNPTSGSRNIKNWTYTNAILKFTGSGGTMVVNASKTVSGFALGAGSIGKITSGQTLTVNGNFTSTATTGSHATLNAVTGGSRANMPVSGTATVNYVDGTDIDSSGGTQVNASTGGSANNTVNWLGRKTCTWTGTNSGNWNVAANWGGLLPVAGDDLVFPSGGANKSTNNDFTADTSFNSITISGTGNYTLAGNSVIVTGTITDSATSNTNVISMVMKGTAALTKSGAGGTLTLSGANTFSGGVTVSNGVLNINNASALGTGTFTISGGAIDNTTGGLITNSNNNTQAWNGDFAFNDHADLDLGTGNVTLGGNRVVSTATIAGKTLTVGGAISGGYTLTKNSGGNLVLSGANTYTGLTTVSAGTLTLSGDNSSASGGVTVSGTGWLNINSATALGTGTFTISSGGTINNSTSGLITNTKNNTMAWNGDFTFRGTKPLDLGTGAVTLGANINISVIYGAASLTIGGAIGDGGHAYTLTETGGGTSCNLILAGNNTYTGVTTIATHANPGVVTLSGDNSAASGGVTMASGSILNINSATALGTGTFTINGGYIDNTSTGAITNSKNNTMVWNGDFIYYGTKDLNLGTGAVTLGANRQITFIYGSGRSLTIGGPIGDSGNGYTLNIVNTGFNQLILSGASTFTGGTTIGGGNIQLNNANALQNSTVTVNSANGLTFGPSIGTFTLGGLAGSSNFALTDTGAAAVTLQVGQNNSSTTYSAVMSGANGAVTKQGTGILIFDHANTYTGATTISGGTIQSGINAPFASGSVSIAANTTLDLQTFNLGAGGTSFANNGTIKLYGDQTISNAPTLNAGSSVEYTATAGSRNIQNWTYNNSILKFTGSGGTMVVNASKTVSGFALGAGAAGKITSGQTLTVNGNFTSTATTGSHATLSAVTGGSRANMPVSGAATVNYVDGTDIDSSGGTAVDNSTGGAATNTVNWLGRKTCTWTGTNSGNWNVAANWGGTLPSAGDDLVFPAGGSNKSTNNDFTADTTFNSITLSGGAGGYTLAGNSAIITTSITDSDTSSTNVISMVMKGTAALTKSGAGGTLTLSGANTFSGGVTLSNGILNINHASALGTGTFTITGGAFDNTSGSPITSSTNNAMNWSGLFTFSDSKTLDLGTGAVVLSGNTTIQVTNGVGAGLTVGGAISGGFSLTKNWTGTLILNGANSYSGGTVINSGTLTLAGNNTTSGGVALSGGRLNINHASALGSGTFAITSGAFDNTSGSPIVSSTNNAMNWNGSFTFSNTNTLDLGTGAVTLGGNSSVSVSAGAGAGLTVGGAISGGFSLSKNWTGKLILSGANTFSGATTISSGFIQLNNANALQNSTVTVNSANGLAFGPSIGTFTLGGLAGASNFSLLDTGSAAVTLQVGQNNSSTTYSAVMSGANGAVTKQGTGILIFDHANTYTGATTISGGTIQSGINAPFASGSVSIAANTTLDLQTFNLGAGGTSFANNGTIKLYGDQTISNAPTNNAGSTVEYNATAGSRAIKNWTYTNATLKINGHGGTFLLPAALTATNLTVADGTLDTDSTNHYNITLSGNLDQSSILSKLLARASTITINGNGTFTADGTVDSTQYNSASLTLNGTNTLTYNNLLNGYASGFNNLTVGQSGLTTTLATNSYFSVISILTVGSGTLTGGGGVGSLFLLGSNPLIFDVNSHLSLSYKLEFFGTNQTIPTLTNGYDCTVAVSNGSTVVTQTGNISIINSRNLLIYGDGFANRADTWKTNGYNLTVSANVTIGAGADSALKKIDATNYTNPDTNAKSTITVGGNWLNYGTGTVPSQFVADDSTVILTGTGAGETITSGATNSPFYNLTQTGVAGTYTLQDALVVGNTLSLNAGTLDVSATNKAVTVGGDFIFNGGAFTKRAGMVTFNGGGAQSITSAGNSFNDITITNSTVAGVTFADAVNMHNLNCSTAGATINFKEGVTHILTGVMNIQGAIGNKVKLRSASTPTKWKLNPTNTNRISYTDIKDSQNLGKKQYCIKNRDGCVDSGNNTGWVFRRIGQ
ncbi:MAG: autotransporter-associated beta strand repeat-containing protein [Candidatus Omnitrophica bacterium]|nr:autotransporter-associated beta strand repeat-containing protein [Candidatus Omnitrophota bacterium]